MCAPRPHGLLQGLRPHEPIMFVLTGTSSTAVWVVSVAPVVVFYATGDLYPKDDIVWASCRKRNPVSL
jgi:hypothetical protein